MRVRFWSEDGELYVCVRPEDYRETVKRKRKKGKSMPIPKPAKQIVGTSHSSLLALGETEKAELLTDLLEDIETTLQNSGKDAMISIKLGYRSGYQVSLKTTKTGMWYNLSANTLFEAFKRYLEGEFDNA